MSKCVISDQIKPCSIFSPSESAITIVVREKVSLAFRSNLYQHYFIWPNRIKLEISGPELLISNSWYLRRQQWLIDWFRLFEWTLVRAGLGPRYSDNSHNARTSLALIPPIQTSLIPTYLSNQDSVKSDVLNLRFCPSWFFSIPPFQTIDRMPFQPFLIQRLVSQQQIPGWIVAVTPVFIQNIGIGRLIARVTLDHNMDLNTHCTRRAL